MDQIAATTRAEWRRWLSAHHASSAGIWLVLSKKGSGIPSVSYDDAVEEALCFGWIDAKVQRIDDALHRQWFAPRRPGGAWSRPNKERVGRLIGQGRMTTAGLAAIERAKRDGTWAAGDALDRLEVPPDFRRALAAAKARATFDSFSPSARRAVLAWIAAAKKPETRARRIETAARMAGAGLRATIDDDPGA